MTPETPRTPGTIRPGIAVLYVDGHLVAMTADFLVKFEAGPEGRLTPVLYGPDGKPVPGRVDLTVRVGLNP